MPKKSTLKAVPADAPAAGDPVIVATFSAEEALELRVAMRATEVQRHALSAAEEIQRQLVQNIATLHGIKDLATGGYIIDADKRTISKKG